MSKTPRTDAVFTGESPWSESAVRQWSTPAGHFIDLSRQLETENAELREALTRLLDDESWDAEKKARAILEKTS